MISDPCYISSGAFKTNSVPEIIACALEAGLHHIELGSGTSWAPALPALIRDTSQGGLHYLIHNYFPPHAKPFVLNLAASDPAILALSLAHCQQAVDLSVELGSKFFSVHAGFAFAAKPDDLGKDLTGVPRFPLEQAHRTFVKSLRHLCAYSMERGVRFVVENNVIAPFNLVGGKNRLGLCATAEDILQTYLDVGSHNLGFLIDVGHLKVTANALGFDAHAFLDRVGPYVVAFHLSDNDGSADQNLPFSEDAWFLPRLTEFPRAVMILEAYRLQLAQIRACCAVIESAL